LELFAYLLKVDGFIFEVSIFPVPVEVADLEVAAHSSAYKKRIIKI
jgi:hypothetical protein